MDAFACKLAHYLAERMHVYVMTQEIAYDFLAAWQATNGQDPKQSRTLKDLMEQTNLSFSIKLHANELDWKELLLLWDKEIAKAPVTLEEHINHLHIASSAVTLLTRHGLGFYRDNVEFTKTYYQRLDELSVGWAKASSIQAIPRCPNSNMPSYKVAYITTPDGEPTQYSIRYPEHSRPEGPEIAAMMDGDQFVGFLSANGMDARHMDSLQIAASNPSEGSPS